MIWHRLLSVPFATAIACIALSGCHKSVSPGGSEAPVTYTQIDPATAGTIEGVIHYDQPAPKRVEIDMAQDPACSLSGANLAEQTVVSNGKLANVYLSIESGLGSKAYSPSSTPVVLDQKGCRYTPHVIAAQVGQPIEFRNSDSTMHNVHMEPSVGGNQAYDISQPPNGGTVRHVFNKPEAMIPVRCNNHPWMQAWINISSNPFFAVSDQAGHYAIHGLPPGTYTLSARQEQLPPQTATVTVTSHGTTQTDFHFSSK